MRDKKKKFVETSTNGKGKKRLFQKIDLTSFLLMEAK